ncbi:hypothetical protein [Streptomyces sp. NPDC058664]|uniref:hypothetical protein n=1 Tax=unclassified Streptomyces TaxID=2593676 RepID=UPI0036648775
MRWVGLSHCPWSHQSKRNRETPVTTTAQHIGRIRLPQQPAGIGEPLTSEPPLPDAEPLTSEPPLTEAAPLTSEPTAPGSAGGTESPGV